MSLASNVQSLATRVATEVKSLRTLINGNSTDLSALTTTAKNNLVAAINEVNAVPAGVQINDEATATTSTWSSSKINTEVNAILDGAPAALDTLNELAAAIADDASYASTVTTALSNRVRTDIADQGLTGTQQTNARTNIAAASSWALTTLSNNVGDTSTNFVTTFEAGL